MNKDELLRDKAMTAAELAKIAVHHVSYTGGMRDVVAGLRDFRRLIQTAESAQRTAIEVLRNNGATWQEIADALEISRQSAHKTYGP